MSTLNAVKHQAGWITPSEADLNSKNENQDDQVSQENNSSLKSKMALQARLNEVKARLGQIKKSR